MPGDSFAIAALRRKRAHLHGEIQAAERVIKKQRGALATLDAVIRMFSPDCNPDMIAPIQPARVRLFFAHGELPRRCLSILREAGKPIALERVVASVIQAKDLNVTDKRVMRHIMDSTRATLIRMARKGLVRRILDEPCAWWELAGPD